MNTLTLTDLNFYYPYLRKIAEKNLQDLGEDYTEELLSNNIRLLLSSKIQNPKSLKKEIDELRNTSTEFSLF